MAAARVLLLAGEIAEVIVLTSYYRDKPGGLCKRLRRAVGALAASGAEVHYLALEPFLGAGQGIVFHRFAWPFRKRDGLAFWTWFHLVAPLQLLGIALRRRVTHAFAFAPTYAAVLGPAVAVRRIPLTLLFRADTRVNSVVSGRSRIVLAIEGFVERIAMRRSRVLAVSNALARSLRERHPRHAKRIGVLPNELPQAVAPLRQPHATLRLASVGVIEARKNQLFLLDALAVLSRDASWQMTFYGVGPLEPALRERSASLGLGERVELRGWCEPRELWSAVDVLLFPSLHEGAPNAVLEAVAHGVAVIASDLPEHREVLGDAGLLPLGDTAAWTHAIEEMLREPERIAALAARQRDAAAALRFDWDARVVAAITELAGAN